MTTEVQIGNTTWDQHTGALTPRAGTSVREERQADGSVKLFPQSIPDQSEGTITTTRLLSSEREALALNFLASALVDSRVSIALPGVVLAGIRVSDVQVGHEKKLYRANEEWLVTAIWTFGPKGNDDGDPRELYVTTKVETCTVWGKWTPQPDLIATACADAFGASGTASLLQIIDTTDEDAVPLEVLGHWVRISIPTGDDLVRPTGYRVDWHGRIKTRDVGTSEGRITAVFSAIDLRDEFDTYLTRWYVKAGDSVIDPGEMPPFNFAAQSDGNAATPGDRSTEAIGPDDTYAHDRNQSAGVPWRGSHIVDSLLAALQDQLPGGPEFTLAGQRTALDNFHPCELDGRSVGEQIAQIISRGLGYRITVNDAGAAEVKVNSPLRAALTAGGWTIPANDRQTTIDLSDDEALQGWSLGEDHSLLRDLILLQLGRPWHCTSLCISPFNDQQFRKDYTDAEVTAWAAADKSKRNTTLSHVYRRFRLHSGWLGGGYATSTAKMALTRDTVTDAAHGVAGEDGTFSTQDGVAFLPRAIRFTKALPFTQGGQDWSDPAYGVLDPREPLERPFICVVTEPGEPSERWDRLDNMEISIDSDAPVITLGSGVDDALRIKALFDAGKHLIVTIGYRLPKPWRVSWRRDPAAQITSRPRSVLYQRPEIDYRVMDDQTVVGLNGRQPVFANPGLIGAKPETPDQLLALARLSHENPFRDLTWTKAGLDTTAAYEPGALVTDATLPWGGDAGTVRTLDGVIAYRSRNLDRSRPATSWSCARRVADVMITPEQQPLPPGLNAAELAALAYKS
jgi:hypothetical protein